MGTKQTKNILIITMDYPPSQGGIQRFTLDLVEGLNEKGYAVKILNFDGRDKINDIKLSLRDFFYTEATKNAFFSLKNICNPFNLTNPGGYRDFVYSNMVYRITNIAINKLHPDIIHITKPNLYTAIYNCNIPFVVTCHSEEVLNTYPVLYSLTNAAIIHCVSNFTKDRVRRILNKDNIKVIYNSTTNKYLGTREESYPMKYIISISRIVKRKNLENTIKAYALLPKQLKDEYKYLIVGDGAEKQNLISLVDSMGLQGKVIFKGTVDEPTKWKLLKGAKTFISCPTEYKGEHEGFGITFIEAQICGVPVIGSDDGGCPEAIGDGGLIVQDELNPIEISRNIYNLLTNQSLYSSLLTNSSKRIHFFTRDYWINNIVELYKNI